MLCLLPSGLFCFATPMTNREVNHNHDNGSVENNFRITLISGYPNVRFVPAKELFKDLSCFAKSWIITLNVTFTTRIMTAISSYTA